MPDKILLRFTQTLARACATLLLGVFISALAWGQQQQGKASYYSKRATGARTASGERLHHDSMTCAHKYYPFGTMLKVTNLANKKSVVVKVTDRGPFTRGRIIDLSWGAAKEIDMIRQGVAPVKVEVVDEVPIPMRPKEDNDLPRMDFELAEATYSFIDKWKEGDKKAEETTSPKAKSHKKTRRQTTAGKEGHSKKKSSREPQPESKEEHNTWNSVFDKLKNVF